MQKCKGESKALHASNPQVDDKKQSHIYTKEEVGLSRFKSQLLVAGLWIIHPTLNNPPPLDASAISFFL